MNKIVRINYYPETDSLNINLSHKTSVDSEEVAEGIVLDYDETGALVGVDIDQASKKVEINEISFGHLPLTSAVSRIA